MTYLTSLAFVVICEVFEAGVFYMLSDAMCLELLITDIFCFLCILYIERVRKIIILPCVAVLEVHQQSHSRIESVMILRVQGHHHKNLFVFAMKKKLF